MFEDDDVIHPLNNEELTIFANVNNNIIENLQEIGTRSLVCNVLRITYYHCEDINLFGT